MPNMKKILSLLVLSALAFLLLSACNLSGNTVKGGHEMKLNVDDSEWKDSVNVATQLKNTTSGGYADEKRTGLFMQNSGVNFEHSLTQTKNNVMSELGNLKSGENLLKNTMDVVFVDEDLRQFTMSTGSEALKGNIENTGFYYSKAALENIGFKAPGTDEDIVELQRWDFNDSKNFKLFQTIKSQVDIEQADGNSFKFTVNTSTDPFIGNSSLKLGLTSGSDTPDPLDDVNGNVIQLKIKGEGISQLSIYFSTDDIGLSEESRQTFSGLEIGTGYSTITLVMTNPNWKGILRSLRIDMDGSSVGAWGQIEWIRICEMKDSYLPVKGEKSYHVLADRLYQNISLEAVDSFSVTELYMEMVIRGFKYEEIEIGAGGEIFSDISDAFDKTKVEYVGLSIIDGSTFGIIAPASEEFGRIEILKPESDLIIRQYFNTGGKKSFAAGDNIEFGFRVYHSETGGFEGLRKDAFVERNPLTSSEITAEGGAFIGYDPYSGFYNFEQANAPMKVSVTNSDNERIIYIKTNEKDSKGLLKASVITDINGDIIPINVQVSKGLGEKPYAVSILPIYLSELQALEFNLINIYEEWGNYPVKQVSSEQSDMPLYNFSSGTINTLSVAPHFVGGLNGLLISGHFTPSGESTGEGIVFEYKSSLKKDQLLRYISSNIKSCGPVFNDLNMKFLTLDKKISAEVNIKEIPQTDALRTYIKLELTFEDEVTINSMKENFKLWKLNGGSTRFSQYSYINASGETETKTAEADNSITLGKETPYIAIYGFESGANDSLLIKNFKMTVNGQEQETSLVLNYNDSAVSAGGNEVNQVWLSVDGGETTFSKGDKVVLEMISMPYTGADDAPVKTLRDDYSGDITAEVSVGSVVESGFIPKVTADKGKAAFTVKGGSGNVVVCVEGFNSYTLPAIQVDGSDLKLTKSSSYKDGYQVYVDDSGCYAFAFVVPTGASVQVEN